MASYTRRCAEWSGKTWSNFQAWGGRLCGLSVGLRFTTTSNFSGKVSTHTHGSPSASSAPTGGGGGGFSLGHSSPRERRNSSLASSEVLTTPSTQISPTPLEPPSLSCSQCTPGAAASATGSRRACATTEVEPTTTSSPLPTVRRSRSSLMRSCASWVGSAMTCTHAGCPPRLGAGWVCPTSSPILARTYTSAVSSFLGMTILRPSMIPSSKREFLSGTKSSESCRRPVDAMSTPSLTLLKRVYQRTGFLQREKYTMSLIDTVHSPRNTSSSCPTSRTCTMRSPQGSCMLKMNLSSNLGLEEPRLTPLKATRALVANSRIRSLQYTFSAARSCPACRPTDMCPRHLRLPTVCLRSRSMYCGLEVG
mmetsp:Transcript_6221/g.21319  ORF Transcript_6221/g.21319 Transcript_6221/m.21319 type:complete len:365 (-) Transcript_6221:2389-3483(-)